MSALPLPGLFVTGTDTGVGKTFAAAAIARYLTQSGRRVGVLKPVASGCERRDGRLVSEDAEHLIRAVGDRSIPLERVNPIAFEAPLAPNVAARLGGSRLLQAEVEREVRGALAWWRARCEGVIVEGVGGFLCPLAEGTTAADLAIFLDFPVLIIARLGLGTLNHTLLTVEAARSRALRVAGVILNAAEPAEGSLAEQTNPEELAARLPKDVPILAISPREVGDGSRPKLFDALRGCQAWLDRSRRIPDPSEIEGGVENGR